MDWQVLHGLLPGLQEIPLSAEQDDGASYPRWPSVAHTCMDEHMCIENGGFRIIVTEKLMNRADISFLLQKACGE
jgi:hypothetical protein